MKYIYKLPILLSILFSIIAAISSIVNGKDLSQLAYEVSLIIIIAYPLGIVLRAVIIRIIKEVLVKRYLHEQQEMIKRRKKKENEFNLEV